jgi:hypothetical protein
LRRSEAALVSVSDRFSEMDGEWLNATIRRGDPLYQEHVIVAGVKRALNGLGKLEERSLFMITVKVL